MSEYIVDVADNDIAKYKSVFQKMPDYLLGYPVCEEIVRCRDCKYYSEINNEERWCGAFDFVTSDDISNGFCAWGKKRRNESLAEFIEREGRKRDTND